MVSFYKEHKELIDQSAHAGSNFVLTLLTAVPLLGVLVVALWAWTREYYQHKVDAFPFCDNLPRWNTDLFWSHIGMVAGIVVSAIVWAKVLGWF